MMPSFNIYLSDSVNNPLHVSRNADAPIINFSGDSESTVRYKVWIYLDGSPKDLFYIDYVIYHLHPTFANPIVKVERTPSNPVCALAIETWGVFSLKAEVFTKNDARFVLEHTLTFDKEINKPSASFKRYTKK